MERKKKAIQKRSSGTREINAPLGLLLYSNLLSALLNADASLAATANMQMGTIIVIITRRLLEIFVFACGEHDEKAARTRRERRRHKMKMN